MIKNFYGLVSKVKSVLVMISASYLDYINILTSGIILLILPSKLFDGAPNTVYL